MAVILVFVPVGLLARFRAVSRAQASATFWVCGAAVGRQTALDALMHGEDERGTGRAVLFRRARQSRQSACPAVITNLEIGPEFEQIGNARSFPVRLFATAHENERGGSAAVDCIDIDESTRDWRDALA
jgi:hypothetical protein